MQTITIKAIFDGQRVILPDDIRPTGPGMVDVTFPEHLLKADAPRHSIWDVINRAVPSGRTVDDVNREIRELRDEWDDH